MSASPMRGGWNSYSSDETHIAQFARAVADTLRARLRTVCPNDIRLGAAAPQEPRNIGGAMLARESTSGDQDVAQKWGQTEYETFESTAVTVF